MRRWNGWGDDSVDYPLHASSQRFLDSLVGIGARPKQAGLQELIKRVPKSRLHSHPLVSVDPFQRLTHTRGQSFPNWLDLRSGQLDSFPDGVGYPLTDEDVNELIQYASRHGYQIIPYGGGTSVVGHIDVMKGRKPVLTIDMSHMNRLVDLNATSLQATFMAGVSGPVLESQLRAHGYTLGHYPQSFEYSTLGGWIATRSSGQQSLRYGRIEKLFAGGNIETPTGTLNIPAFPASAAGPDLREIILGSEGRLGIITQACVRISPIPEREDFHAVFFPDFQHGIEAVRQILSYGIQCCMLRLSTAIETSTTLALAGHENLIGALERLLSIRGLGEKKCMLLLGFSGKASLVRAYRSEALDITSIWGGVHVGKTFGEQWHRNRFKTPYLRNTLWEMGYGIDTLETAIDWGKTIQMVDQIESTLRQTMESFNEKVHVFTHLSHVYPYGSSVYTTYLFRLAATSEDTLSRWQAMKAAASRVIVSLGGTISHQHGIGMDHVPYLPAEKGPLAIKTITSLCHQFDPKGMMNPGKLVL
ncbi:MAG: FAD-binding oxidoreductase [Anaerolineae bacterium]|nr:FAD-binding oxidoreductase [Anaerolineae bacterium]